MLKKNLDILLTALLAGGLVCACAPRDEAKPGARFVDATELRTTDGDYVTLLRLPDGTRCVVIYRRAISCGWERAP